MFLSCQDVQSEKDMGGHFLIIQNQEQASCSSSAKLLWKCYLCISMHSWHYFCCQRLSKTLLLPYNYKMLKEKVRALFHSLLVLAKIKCYFHSIKLTVLPLLKVQTLINILCVKCVKFKSALKMYICR